MYKLKPCFLMVCVLGILFVWFYYCIHTDCMSLGWKKHEAMKYVISYNSSSSPCGLGKPATDTFTAVPGSKAFIIAPYYDDRAGRVIRTLAIVHHQHGKNLYCSLCCSADKSLHTFEATVEVHTDRFGFPYGLADIVCKEPPDCRPRHMYLHKSPAKDLTKLTRFQIHNRKREGFVANFTVCTSPIYGNYSNALQLLQTIELYKLLGAQKVVVYLKSCSQKVKEILDYYSREGSVDLVPWPIQDYLRPSSKWRFSDDQGSDIGYFGQMSAINDCVYRNMYKSRFVLMNDIDEIILPFHHLTWDELMNHIQTPNPGGSIFLFENHVFPQTVITDGGFSGVSSWKRVPGFNLLQHVYREPDRPKIFNPRKMIVDPRAVVQISVHSVLKGSGPSINVSPTVALVHHCRSPWQPNLNKSFLIEDKTIWNYSSSLIAKVNQVLDQLSLP